MTKSYKKFYTYDQLITNYGEAYLDESESGHLVKVLRLPAGEKVVIFTKTQKFLAEVIRPNSKKVVLKTLEPLPIVEDASPVGVALAIIKPANFELAVEALTQLGVEYVQPFYAENSQLSIEIFARKLERMEKIILAATKQCKRDSILQIRPPISFAKLLKLSARKVFLTIDGAENAGAEFTFMSKDLLVIGPEGGFSSKEDALITSGDYLRLSLATPVLTSEIAAIAASTLAVDYLHRSRKQ